MTKINIKVFISALAMILFMQFSKAQCVTIYDTLSPTICAGDSFLFNGIWRKTAARPGRPLPSDTVVLGSGCDSITSLRLTVLRLIKDSINQAICTGGSYTFNGQTLTTAGVYRDTLTSVAGCDSFVIVNLSVGAYQTFNTRGTLCNGDSVLFGGIYRNRTGTYYDTIPSAGSCDSIVVLILTVSAAVTSTINQQFCQGSSYPFNGNTITTPGNYYDTIVNGARSGCDSIVIFKLQPSVSRGPVIHDTICTGDTLVLPSGNGYIFINAGNYRPIADTLLLTCTDSINTYVVTVDSPSAPMISAASYILSETLSGYVSYQWQVGGNDITGATQMTDSAMQNGTYTVVAWDALGCSAASNAVNITGVGINPVSGNIMTRIYPNPNSGSFELETTGAIGSEATVYNVLGEAVAHTAVTKDNMNISLNVPSGVYLLKLSNNGAINSLKFTVTK